MITCKSTLYRTTLLCTNRYMYLMKYSLQDLQLRESIYLHVWYKFIFIFILHLLLMSILTSLNNQSRHVIMYDITPLLPPSCTFCCSNCFWSSTWAFLCTSKFFFTIPAFCCVSLAWWAPPALSEGCAECAGLGARGPIFVGVTGWAILLLWPSGSCRKWSHTYCTCRYNIQPRHLIYS